MINNIILTIFTFLSAVQLVAIAQVNTVCNPMDLRYRFTGGSSLNREAADPTVILFKDTYYLFASKSGGYWYSDDLKEWSFIKTDEIPVEEYAPTAIVLGDTVYFLASSNTKSTVYKSTDPKSGHWQVAKDELDSPVWDPAFFLDSDGKLYLYWGCSNREPIYGVEVNKEDFSFIGSPQAMLSGIPQQYGWEVRGDYNNIYGDAPWVEGAWLNKHNGKYYLQYAVPGTQFKSYCDGAYVADSPLGPYRVTRHNPFAYKPEGYACGAGHGSTFADKHGNLWHVGTISISVKHHFERRLAFYPAFFDEKDILYSTTKYGDYPLQIPDQKIQSADDIFPDWMLLSYKKPVEVSSMYDSDHLGANMCDEDIRTYWSAVSGSSSEWACLDLEASCDIYAIQINLAEHNSYIKKWQTDVKHQYTVEGSNDKINWTMVLDKSQNDNDNTHDYTQLPQKINFRYLRIKNIQVPDGQFAISGFRVFGKGVGEKPQNISELTVTRNSNDRRSVNLEWSKSNNATGYVISYGNSLSKLYHHYMVYEDTDVVIRSLDVNLDYWFTIEAFNENGITKSGLLRSDGPQSLNGFLDQWLTSTELTNAVPF